MSRNIHQRIAAAMKKVTYIQKEKRQGMRYSIVSHDAVTAKVRPALLEEGVIYYPVEVRTDQVGNRTQAHVTVRFINIDDPEDMFQVETFGYGIDDQDKGPGKAMSYAVKYALLKTLGLETGDDPDEDQNVTFNNPVMASLETMMGLVVDQRMLDDMAAEIKKHSTNLQPAELARLRQLFVSKQKELGK
jgi:hypothetical protein